MIWINNSSETRCPHCEAGRIIYFDDDGYCGTTECKFCLGKGKLDWIEKVVGVTKPIPNHLKPGYPASLALKTNFSKIYKTWLDNKGHFQWNLNLRRPKNSNLVK